MVNVAEIYIWNSFVGAILWDEKRRLGSFEYSKEFISLGWELSPLKMPLNNGPRIYDFPELRKSKEDDVDTYKGLPGLVADSLPGRYGNQLIDIWLAQQGRPPASMNPIEQLCFIGHRGMGALEFKPTSFDSSSFNRTIEISTLVETAHLMLQERKLFQTNLHEDQNKAVQEILKLGTSAGGARPKAVIAYNPKTGIIRSGQQNVSEGFEHWIIKLDGVSNAQFGSSSGYGRVEYAYYLMAKAAGIEMMESVLLEENNRAHFMTKRFDRSKDQKHHIQTLCGIQHFNYNHLFSYSYEQLFQTMRMLRLPYSDAEQMFRRMVFNVLATNCDDHTKNFSFRLVKDQKWKLAPAYDICFSYDPQNVWVNQQTLSINGKHIGINEEDFLKIAKENNIKKAKIIIQEINEVVKQWETFAVKAKLGRKLSDYILQYLRPLSR